MMDSTLHYTSVSHTGTLMATINKMRVNSDLCDVTVVVGEYRIMAHRIILSASAPFFYQMLQLHSQPHNHNSQNEVQLDNIDEIAALKIIEFCYTSAISLDDETVWPLLAASIKFQLPEICSFCCEFLVSGLDASNCILSLRLAAKVHCPQLEENCVRFLLENIEQACVSGGLTSLASPDLYSLLSVLVLHDVSPSVMATLVTAWMEEDRTIRQEEVFTQVLQVFPSMSPFLHRLTQSSAGHHWARNDGNTHKSILKEDGPKVKNDGMPESTTLASMTKTNEKPICPNGKDLQTARLHDPDGSPVMKDVDENRRTSKGISVYGIGASREFICISCGDDFDCEEELVSHQNECDESARMVGSASGDSLRESLSKKHMSDNCSISERGESTYYGDLDGHKNGLDHERVGSKENERLSDRILPEIRETEFDEASEQKSSMEVDDEPGPLKEAQSSGSLTELKEIRDSQMHDDQQRRSGNVCINDNNNNDINRSVGGSFGPESKSDGTSSNFLLSKPDMIPNANGSLSVTPKVSRPDTTFPNFLSTDNHFKTKKSLDSIESLGKINRYASSLTAMATSSSSLSLQHLKPQNKCQLCGKALWDKKLLANHWVYDHGVKSKSLEDDEQEIYDAHQPKDLKVSPFKEIHNQTETVGNFPTSSWPFSTLQRYSSADAMMKSGFPTLNTTNESSPESLSQSVKRDAVSTSLTGESGQPLLGEEDFSERDQNETVRDLRRPSYHDLQHTSVSDKVLQSYGLKPNYSIADFMKDPYSNSAHCGSVVKEENLIKNEDDHGPSASSVRAATLTLPGQAMAPSDFFTNYLNHYNKLAQWCLTQGPNFCTSCLVYHTNGSPCPRSLNRSSSSSNVSPHQTPFGIKTEKKEIKEEAEDDDEDKDVNVDDEDDEMTEGPLDMSKTSLDFTVNLSSSFSTPGLTSLIPSLHSIPASASNDFGMPSHYKYAPFLSGNTIMDLSAMTPGNKGVTADVGRQPRSQDMALSILSGTAVGSMGNDSSFGSFNPFSISSSSSIGGMNGNKKEMEGGLNPTSSSSKNNILINTISSTSPSSSSYSFPTSSPKTSSTQPVALPGSGRKKTTTPKQGFPCTVCNRVYSHQSALFTHMRSHSPSTRSYRCQFCQESFARAPDLKVHICPNGVEKPFTCPSCGQTFAKNIHLKRHLATHSGLKPYPCWICGKRFSRSDHLKRHTQSIHAGARPHVCTTCGKEFVRKYELNKHMTTHNT